MLFGSSWIDNLNPVFCVATVCQQVRCMYWGHLGLFGLFDKGISPLNWYNIVCTGDLAIAIFFVDQIYEYILLVFAVWSSLTFLLNIYFDIYIEPYWLYFYVYPRCPHQTLVAVCGHVDICDLFSAVICSHGLILIPVCTSNYIHYKMWDEITNQFPSFNDETVEVWEYISNFIQYLTAHVMTYPWWD